MSSPMLPDANSIVIKGKPMLKNVEFGRKNLGLDLKILKIHVSLMNFEPKVKPLEYVTCFYIVLCQEPGISRTTTTMKIGGFTFR